MMSTSCQRTTATVSDANANETTVGLNDGSHRGRTEEFSVQLPLAVDVVLRDLHFESSRLSIEQLHTVDWPDHLDVASCGRGKQSCGVCLCLCKSIWTTILSLKAAENKLGLELI